MPDLRSVVEFKTTNIDLFIEGVANHMKALVFLTDPQPWDYEPGSDDPGPSTTSSTPRWR